MIQIGFNEEFDSEICWNGMIPFFLGEVLNQK